jgi:NAD(P)-dependent dehydrogenase (short-subunit alcohol dehydrogenase family)
MRMTSLAGKVAVITGAGSGMGRITALLMASRGARIMVSEIVPERAEETVRQIRAQGGEAASFVGDVTVEDEVAAMIEAAITTFGRLDILHNNAADLRPESYGRDSTTQLHSMDVALWDHMMNINLKGPMLCSKHAVPEMIRSGGGSIINVSSNAGLHGQDTTFAYGVSKAGVNMLTKYTATAYGKQGIRCNSVAPGLVMTEVARSQAPKALLDILNEHILTPFAGEPLDIAHVVAFLASDEARYITGQTIAVDGGLTAHAPYVPDLRRLTSSGG